MTGTHNNESNKYDYLRYLLAERFGTYSGPSFLSILRDLFSNYHTALVQINITQTH